MGHDHRFIFNYEIAVRKWHDVNTGKKGRF